MRPVTAPATPPQDFKTAIPDLTDTDLDKLAGLGPVLADAVATYRARLKENGQASNFQARI